MSPQVAGFSAAAQGFAFPNAFPAVPLRRVSIPGIGELTLGNAANGLCGGMAFAACDYFLAPGVQKPAETQPPAEGTPLFKYLVDRLVDSFNLPIGIARYCEWMALPDNNVDGVTGVADRTRSGWTDVRRVLDGGIPAPLGLIRVHSANLGDLGRNHQVLAYGYVLDPPSSLTVELYDPNHPGAAVSLSCDLDSANPLNLTYSAGEPTRAFFLTDYTPRRPPDPLASSAIPTSWLDVLIAWLRRILP